MTKECGCPLQHSDRKKQASLSPPQYSQTSDEGGHLYTKAALAFCFSTGILTALNGVCMGK